MSSESTTTQPQNKQEKTIEEWKQWAISMEKENELLKQQLLEKGEIIQGLQSKNETLTEHVNHLKNDKKKLQEKMDSVESTLINTIAMHNKCGENGNKNEAILKGLEELKQQIQETSANMAVFKKEMETVMKQLNVEELNLKLRVAKLIQNDSMNRKIVECIIGKFTMMFSDCHAIMSKYVEISPEFGNSILNTTADAVHTGSVFLSNVPTLGMMLQITDYVLGKVGSMKMQQLYQNVSSFENKISSENTWILPKIFALKLLAMEEFDKERKQETHSNVCDDKKEEHSEDDSLHLVEQYCLRMITILMSGIMGSLWDVYTQHPRQRPQPQDLESSSVVDLNTGGDGFVVVKVLEQIVDQVMLLLEVGKSDDVFHNSWKTNSKNILERIKQHPTDEKISTLPSKDTILKEGWIEKYGQFPFNRPQQRKFILRASGILCFQRPKTEKEVAINLIGANGIKRSGELEINIETTDRKWVLKCVSHNQREEWFQAMIDVVCAYAN